MKKIRKIIKKILMIILNTTKVFETILILRNLFYKIIFKEFWKNSSIFWSIKVYNAWNVYLWNNSFINEWVTLCATNKIIIWDYCHISAYSKLYTVWLDLSQKDYKIRTHIDDKIVIENGVWIWLWSIILKWVTIWEWSVIAAWAVVTKNVPHFEIWAWVPAKKIKNI